MLLKHLRILRFFLTVAIIFPISLFADVTAVTFTDVGDATLNSNDTNEVTMQVNIADSGSGDTLTSILVKNLGTANEPIEITAVKLWYRAGGGAFNAGSATYVATLTQTAIREWRNESLSFAVADNT